MAPTSLKLPHVTFLVGFFFLFEKNKNKKLGGGGGWRVGHLSFQMKIRNLGLVILALFLSYFHNSSLTFENRSSSPLFSSP